MFPRRGCCRACSSWWNDLRTRHHASRSAVGQHPDARFYKITDRSGGSVGHFIDLYARPSKRGGAWMDDAITRRRRGATSRPRSPISTATSRRPSAAVALFTHDEVSTLFHEFGHGLHHLLTQVEGLGVSGINGVEWDAVELPSQFVKNKDGRCFAT
ncbi:MAG: M3 family metallopeptidase [Burkholderiales bacterium]